MPERLKLVGAYKLRAEDPDVEFFPSGSKMLDLALGGGWAKQRVINIIGDSSTGKTLLCIEASINFLRKYPKGYVRYCEGEEAFSKAHAAEMGLPIGKVDFGDEPIQTVEDLYEEIDRLVQTGKGPGLVIVDSLDSLSSRAELRRAIDEASFGGEKAKQMSALFRRINRAMSRKDITMMIVSQTRDNIGPMAFRKWKRSGGNALQFYTSQIAVLSQIKKLTKTVRGVERTIGIQVQAYIDKNKVGKPFQKAVFPIIFDYGIDDEKSCRDFLATINHKTSKNVELPEIHKIVEREWTELETAFAPKRKKYT